MLDLIVAISFLVTGVVGILLETKRLEDLRSRQDNKIEDKIRTAERKVWAKAIIIGCCLSLVFGFYFLASYWILNY